jgi:hypothetical protein
MAHSQVVDREVAQQKKWLSSNVEVGLKVKSSPPKKTGTLLNITLIVAAGRII